MEKNTNLYESNICESKQIQSNIFGLYFNVQFRAKHGLGQDDISTKTQLQMIHWHEREKAGMSVKKQASVAVAV